MNPSISDILKDWLIEVGSEWKLAHKINWVSASGEGSAESPYGFLVHPLSQHLDEVLWVGPDNGVENPLYTHTLMAADPEFFTKLAAVLDKMATIFKQYPQRNNTLHRSLSGWYGPIDYTGPGRMQWSSK